MMRQFIATLVIVLLVAMASVAYARGEPYVMATVPGDSNPTVAVASLDDPANPYRGEYCLLDKWAYDHFSYYVDNENYSTIQLVMPNIEQTLADRGIKLEVMTFKSYVQLDSTGEKGYLVPIMASFSNADPTLPQHTLGESLLSHDSDSAEEDNRPYFWSVGIRDEQAMTEYHDAVSTWLAPIYPVIPNWMVAVGHDGDQYSFLPDGGVVIAVPEVKDDFSQRKSQLTRYDADGNVVKQAVGDYMDWEHVMLNDVRLGKDNPYLVRKEHVSESGRKSGTSVNMASTGRYTTYINSDHTGFLAVIDYWQGKVLTPADCDLTKLMVDQYPLFGMVSYQEVVQVHNAQLSLR